MTLLSVAPAFSVMVVLALFLGVVLTFAYMLSRAASKQQQVSITAHMPKRPESRVLLRSLGFLRFLGVATISAGVLIGIARLSKEGVRVSKDEVDPLIGPLLIFATGVLTYGWAANRRCAVMRDGRESLDAPVLPHSQPPQAPQVVGDRPNAQHPGRGVSQH